MIATAARPKRGPLRPPTRPGRVDYGAVAPWGCDVRVSARLSVGRALMGQSVASLPPLAEKALNALRRGELTEQQLIVRLRPAHPEAARSVIRLMTADGLIETDDGGVIRCA